jgi:TPR repeat protein
MSDTFPAPAGACEDRIMSQTALRSPMRAAGRMLMAAALAGSVASPVAAQGTRRGLEPRPSATSTGKGFGTYHALIFAVGEQQPSSGLPSLRFPLKEADSLRAVITREYTFDPANVQMVRNPTREAILDSLESVARRLGPEDNLLVVYSGHGGFDEAGREGYWLAADAANSRKSTWIPNESIRTWLRTLKARSVLLITDACFSGSLNRSADDRVTLSADRRMAIEGALRYARRSSRQAMTAGTSKETVPQVSIFSGEIVAALKRHVAPVFMAQQLAGEINPRVAAVAHTTPTFSAVPGIESDQGDFVFVRRELPSDATATVAADEPAAAATGVRRGTPASGTNRTATPATTAATTPVSAAAQTPQRADAAPVQRNNSAPSGAPTSSPSSKMGNIGTSDVVPAAPAAAAAAPTARAGTSRAAPTCDGGVASGCVTRGLNLEYGRNNSTQNVPQAAALYRTACEVKDPEGCMNLGRMYDSPHQSVSMDRGKARQYFTIACDGGSGYACTALGNAAAKGEGGPVEEYKAYVLFAKACDAGDNPGCGRVGLALISGKGIAQDEVRGRSFLVSACNGKDAPACNTLGMLYANGRGGVARDSAKAMTLWRDACNSTASIAESCAYLGAGYLRGSGVMHDDVRAGSFLSQGCEGGIANSCTLLATMYEAGSSVTAKSVTRAAEFYKRGCDGGDQSACTWVKAHPQPAAPKK